jgi:hypothetical protein
LETQDLMKFEHEAHVCTWMTQQLMKRVWSFKFMSFLIHFKNFI